jgi:methylmalonyl-CoA mutase N-terminal domain/subunit
VAKTKKYFRSIEISATAIDEAGAIKPDAVTTKNALLYIRTIHRAEISWKSTKMSLFLACFFFYSVA